ncbi:unnamed protein product (macronuclear) [Paramecium tetraurelia]|uniref:PX domain-containing protein n=1 Tax=Paramecium tetraurelia TaxID=5888 RepID=A0BEV0_PARTE|nr:uncharacterized protein GSPATT00028100001 [Paramecium tetraurelia]CAK57067.1 unnamed protein product [Paramecium tetraurelia]|eukprot:XP_001424465.1 hypothetical protein (macronuclear) [Paramecium tetraurelia strain d4-2]
MTQKAQKYDQTKEKLNQQEQEKQSIKTSSIILQQQQTSDALKQTNENQTSIVIHVSKPMEIKKSQFKSYMVYTIEGSDAWGTFKTERRFKEFYNLRLSLQKFWIGFYIPPLSEKILNPNKDQLKVRHKVLNYFVKRISSIQYLYYSVQFAKIFLRPNETEICKVMESLKPTDFLYQIQVMKQVFQITSEQYDEKRLQIYLKNVQTFLQNSKFLLFKLSRKIQEMINSSATLKEKINSVTGAESEQSEKFAMQDSIEDQDGKMKNYEIGLKIHSNLENMMFTRDKQLEKIHDLIKTEQMDIKAFLEGFKLRLEMVYQKNNDRVKQKQWEIEKLDIEYLSLNDQYQIKYIQESCSIEINKFNHFNLFMMNLEVKKVFEKFKNDKHQSYLTIIKDIADLELSNFSIMNQTWRGIENLAQLKLDKKTNYQMSQ